MQLVGVDADIVKHSLETRFSPHQIYIAICQAFIRTNMANSVIDAISHMRDVAKVNRTYEFYESIMRN